MDYDDNAVNRVAVGIALLGHLLLLSGVFTASPVGEMAPVESVIVASLIHAVAPESAAAPPPSAPALPTRPQEMTRPEPAPVEKMPAVAATKAATARRVTAPPVPAETQPEPEREREIQEPTTREKPVPENSVTAESPAAPEIPAPVTEPASVSERAASAPLSGDPDEIRKYLQDLMRQLKRHKTYPAALKKAKTEGTVELQFTIDRSGRLVASAVKRSSGHPELDRAALEMLANASPLPPIPAFLDRSALSLSIPVEYSLITDR